MVVPHHDRGQASYLCRLIESPQFPFWVNMISRTFTDRKVKTQRSHLAKVWPLISVLIPKLIRLAGGRLFPPAGFATVWFMSFPLYVGQDTVYAWASRSSRDFMWPT